MAAARAHHASAGRARERRRTAASLGAAVPVADSSRPRRRRAHGGDDGIHEDSKDLRSDEKDGRRRGQTVADGGEQE